MNRLPFQLHSLSTVHAIAALPILAAFLLGSLPLLLPLALYAWFGRQDPQPS